MGRYERFRQSAIYYVRKVYNVSQGLAGAMVRLRGSDYEAQHYPKEPITGLAPNVGHDTDSYSSDWALFVDRWSRALYTSLTGKLLRSDVDITEGHKHDSYLDDLDWQEFCRIRPGGDNMGLSGPPEAKALLYTDSNLAGRDINLMCHVPTQFSGADLLCRIAMPSPGTTSDDWFYVFPEVYDLNTDPAVVAKDLGSMQIKSITAGPQFPNYWLGPLFIDLRDFAVVRGFYWIRVRI